MAAAGGDLSREVTPQIDTPQAFVKEKERALRCIAFDAAKMNAIFGNIDELVTEAHARTLPG
jgi:hypothetical protein